MKTNYGWLVAYKKVVQKFSSGMLNPDMLGKYKNALISKEFYIF